MDKFLENWVPPVCILLLLAALIIGAWRHRNDKSTGDGFATGIGVGIGIGTGFK